MNRVLRHSTTAVASTVDRVFAKMALKRGGRKSAEALGPTERHARLLEVAALYDDPRHVAEPDSFFESPPAPQVEQRSIGRSGHREQSDLSWSSGYRPFCDAVGQAYQARAANRTAAARLFAVGAARPSVILIHGYLGGHHRFEQRIWPIEWLNARGINVVLAVLPFHGVRGADRPLRAPVFPNADPRVTIEGFRQAVWDVRTLIGWLEQRGSQDVGVMGMSLGGYTTALLATVERRLSFAVPFIPLACLADFAADRARLIGTHQQRAAQYDLLQTIYRPVSPLSRPPKVKPPGRLVVAASGDRITPIHHAERIADHFDAHLEVFAGGHLFQVGRSQGFRAVGRMLGGLGLFA